MSQVAEGATHEQLCNPAVVTAISAARESVEQYLRNTFDEIGRLQAAPEFLKNVETVQKKTRELDIWTVQREQLSAVEACAASCTCDGGSRLVIAEYNGLASQADKGAGLVTVPLPTNMGDANLWGIAVAVLLVIGGLLWWRRFRLG